MILTPHVPGAGRGVGRKFAGYGNARARGVEICPLCDAYPCERVRELAKGYPMLISDGKRLREIGLERWIAEQEERCRTGFVYADVRCHPYKVPEQ